MASGVYVIWCISNGGLYVGSSYDVLGRMKRHRSALRQGGHGSPLMQRAWDKYSERSFIFYAHEECPVSALIEREQYWIDTLRPEFNISQEAGRVTGFRHTEQERERQAQRARDQWSQRGEEMRASIKRGWSGSGARETRSRLSREHWQDPQKREQNSRAIKAAVSTPEARAARSESRRADWADPEKRARILEGRRRARELRRLSAEPHPGSPRQGTGEP